MKRQVNLSQVAFFSFCAKYTSFIELLSFFFFFNKRDTYIRFNNNRINYRILSGLRIVIFSTISKDKLHAFTFSPSQLKRALYDGIVKRARYCRNSLANDIGDLGRPLIFRLRSVFLLRGACCAHVYRYAEVPSRAQNEKEKNRTTPCNQDRE